MTEPSHLPSSASRFVRLFAALRAWLPGRKARPRLPGQATQADRRKANLPRLGMESLEERTTISDTVLGLVGPTLWIQPGSGESGGPVRQGLLSTPYVGTLDANIPAAAAPLFAKRELLFEAQKTSCRGFSTALEASGMSAAGTWQAGVWDPSGAFGELPDSARSAGVRQRALGPSMVQQAAEPLRAFSSESQPASRQQTSPLVPVAGAPLDVGPSSLLTLAGLRISGTAVAPPPQIQGDHFQVSWQSGDYDDQGTFTAATENLHLVGHKGKLYAGNSVWMNIPLSDPRTGAQILRLDEPTGQWHVDRHFNEETAGGQLRYIRTTALRSVTFATDDQGVELPEPVNLLVASVVDREGSVNVYSRDDDTGEWTEMLLGQSAEEPGQVRSFGVHRDWVTGVDHLFAGGSPLGVFRGTFDPTVPGRIRWDEQPEVETPNRVMSFSEANGYLYMASKPKLYRRIDGPEPFWQVVMDYPDPPSLGEGLRALTPIPAEGGAGNEVILGTFESGGARIVRILPYLGHIYITELDVREFLRDRWGGLGNDIMIAGYNDMIQVFDPWSGEYVHLIGLLASPPQGMRRTSAWYLIRYPNATYDVREIRAQPHPFVANPVLLANRTIAVSPFAEDEGQALYFGGFDPVFLPSRHSGWIYRTSLEAALAPP